MPFSCSFFGALEVCSNLLKIGLKSFSGTGMRPLPEGSHTAAHKGKQGGLLCRGARQYSKPEESDVHLRLLSRAKAGTHSALLKGSHSGPHAETGGFPPSATVRLCAAGEIAAERTAGESGCTSVACVRFLRRRGPARLRNNLFDLPMLHFSRSAHGDFCAYEIGVVSLPPRTVNKTAHICFHS